MPLPPDIWIRAGGGSRSGRPNGRFGVELTRLARRRGVTGICAQQTAGPDVERTFPIAVLDATIGRRARLHGRPREGPESERKPAFQCEPEIEFTGRSGRSSYKFWRAVEEPSGVRSMRFRPVVLSSRLPRRRRCWDDRSGPGSNCDRRALFLGTFAIRLGACTRRRRSARC
jgi:hypothetical protein